jgi:hypothetical protein
MKIIKTAKYVKTQSRWTDSPSELVVNFDIGEMEEIYDMSYDKDISAEMSGAILSVLNLDTIRRGDAEMIIDFASSGYNDPGRPGGPVETSYPPEGADERTVKGVTFLSGGQLAGELNPQFFGIVEQEYQKEINEAAIDTYSDEDRRGDYDFDLMRDEDAYRSGT